jgi:coiled-coil domain-containing protein 12
LKRKAPDPPTTSTTTSEEASQPPQGQDEASVTTTYLSGRNYDPETRGPKLGFETAPDEGKDTLEVRAAALELAHKAEAAKEEQENDRPIDLFKLQPKKPNWDLKRDLKERTKVLDVRTRNAVARLVRERLEAERNKKLAAGTSTASNGEDSVAPLEGGELLEAVHVRERQDEEERRREREEDEEVT